MSTARAAGIWQFIPSTGKHYGLTQNFWMDSRRDVLAATDKALVYLRQAARRLRRLAAGARGLQLGRGQCRARAGEEQGEGPAARRTRPSRCPRRRSNYLPKLQAVKNIVRDPEKYGLALADIPDAPFFTVVKTTRKIDTKVAAQIAELSLEEFIALNPAAQPARDRRRRRAVDPAAHRQRGDLRGQARAHRRSRWCRGRPTA